MPSSDWSKSWVKARFWPCLLKFASFSRHLPFYRSVHCCSIFTSKMWVVIRYTRWNREVIKHDAAILKPYFTPSSVKLYHPFRKTKNSCLKALVKSILQFTGAPTANFFFDRCGKLMKILTKKNNWILRGRNLKSCSEENHNLCHKLAPKGVIINSQSTNQNCVILVQLK